MIRVPTPRTAPRKLRGDPGVLAERMINRDPQAIGVHQGHDPPEFPPVRRTPFLHVKLPLMNHLMGQGAPDLFKGLPGQKRHRQANHAPLAMPFLRIHPRDAWARLAAKETGRSRQAVTPLNLNGRQTVLEIRTIQLAPDRLQMFDWKGNVDWSAKRHDPQHASSWSLRRRYVIMIAV